MENEKKAHTRRKADKFAEDSDHDLLVMHSVKINHICKLVKEVGEKFDNYSDKMDTRCEHRLENFTSKIDHNAEDTLDGNTFKWIIGIMIFAMISMVAMIGVNQVSSSRNGILIETNIGHIEEAKINAKEFEKKMEKYRPFRAIKLPNP